MHGRLRFYPRGILFFIGFIAMVAVALNAREGNMPPAFGVAGWAAIILVDVVLTFWPVVSGGRHRSQERT